MSSIPIQSLSKEPNDALLWFGITKNPIADISHKEVQEDYRRGQRSELQQSINRRPYGFISSTKSIENDSCCLYWNIDNRWTYPRYEFQDKLMTESEWATILSEKISAVIVKANKTKSKMTRLLRLNKHMPYTVRLPAGVASLSHKICQMAFGAKSSPEKPVHLPTWRKRYPALLLLSIALMMLPYFVAFTLSLVLFVYVYFLSLILDLHSCHCLSSEDAEAQQKYNEIVEEAGPECDSSAIDNELKVSLTALAVTFEAQFPQVSFDTWFGKQVDDQGVEMDRFLLLVNVLSGPNVV